VDQRLSDSDGKRDVTEHHTSKDEGRDEPNPGPGDRRAEGRDPEPRAASHRPARPAVATDEHLLDLDAPPPPALIELAHACDVATEWWNWRGQHTIVSTATICSVLGSLDLDVRTHEAVERASGELRDTLWRRVLPPVQVVRQGARSGLLVHIPHGSPVDAWVQLEDGESRTLRRRLGRDARQRIVDGREVGEAEFVVPDDLPLGWHAVHVRHNGGEAGAQLVVTPARLPLPPVPQGRPAWGFMVQLYSMRSRMSWGLGDLADLAELAGWSAREHGADFVLVSPLHAAEPVAPMEASPYRPTSRRFVNPMYLRVEDIPEVAYLAAADRAVLECQAEAMRGLNADPGELDRDAVWAAKRVALDTVFNQPRRPSRQAAFEAFCAREGAGLDSFATWCALAERYGLPSALWPGDLQDPRSGAVAEIRRVLAARVEFYTWLQWCVDEQLERAQRVAGEGGMGLGVVHDLAVGVHPDSADVWALQDVLARGVSAGAPPDDFNQQGQNWGQPPWRPDRLADLAYVPYRDMLRSILRHAGGLRVDHIMGLFRLWWVPTEHPAAAGTYVRYDHEALVGILALEAQRAGAFVVGEDIGTVEPWIQDYLRERGILGTSILWLEKDHQRRPLRPETWRELCLATVTTHDMPPAAGYLAGEHLELRERLGLLTGPVAEETAVDEADRAAVLALLRELGLTAPDATEPELVEALYRFLAWTPARLIGVALADAVGERRAQNQPGTYDEYPNWRLPLADGIGRPVLLEDLWTMPRVMSLARAVNGR